MSGYVLEFYRKKKLILNVIVLAYIKSQCHLAVATSLVMSAVRLSQTE